MFDQLVESKSQGAELKDRRRYFVVSLAAASLLLSTGLVYSIFASELGLGTGNFELVEMIAPDQMAPADPEPEPERPQAQNSSPSTSQVATRVVNMANINEVPTDIPPVSTTRNTYMERPETGRFVTGRFDTNPGNPGGTGRDASPSGPGGLSTGESTTAKAQESDPEGSTPPPAIKKPQVPKSVSKGVLNGQALSLPKPLYSSIAKAAGAQGQVTVQVTIDETGRVISANAVTGHVMLRPEAERAAKGARFSPTRLSDVPVKVTGVITYNFLR